VNLLAIDCFSIPMPIPTPMKMAGCVKQCKPQETKDFMARDRLLFSRSIAAILIIGRFFQQMKEILLNVCCAPHREMMCLSVMPRRNHESFR